MLHKKAKARRSSGSRSGAQTAPQPAFCRVFAAPSRHAGAALGLRPIASEAASPLLPFPTGFGGGKAEFFRFRLTLPEGDVILTLYEIQRENSYFFGPDDDIPGRKN